MRTLARNLRISSDCFAADTYLHSLLEILQGGALPSFEVIKICRPTIECAMCLYMYVFYCFQNICIARKCASFRRFTLAMGSPLGYQSVTDGHTISRSSITERDKMSFLAICLYDLVELRFFILVQTRD